MSSFNPPAGKSLLPSLSFLVLATLSLAQPSISLTTNAPLCAGSPVLTIDEVGGSAVTWYWNGPNGFVSSQQHISITNPAVGAAGLYRVTISDQNGQTATASIQVDIHIPKPLACNDLVIVSLDNNGQATILPQTGLQGVYDFPFYSVEVFDPLGLSLGNTVTCSQIGQSIRYRVTDNCNGNFCWGKLKVEDKTPPRLKCEDIYYSCAIESYAPDFLVNELHIPAGNPVLGDNCGVVSVSFEDAFHDLPCVLPANGLAVSSAWLRRDWTATDASGNKSTCGQAIYFIRRHLSDLHLPPDTVISCSSPSTDPRFTGAPFLTEFGRNYSIFPNEAYCEFAAAFTDDTVFVCDGTRKILRSWTILEDCPENSMPSFIIHEQLIKIMDVAGPTFSCPADQSVTIDPFSCCSQTDLPDVIASDNCSRINKAEAVIQTYDVWTGDSTATYIVAAELGTFPNNNLWLPDTLVNFGLSPCLPQGPHTVTYRVTDDCGNTNSCSFRLQVLDKVPPVASCDTYTQVALGPDGLVEIPAETLNDGSYDRCCATTFYARRMNGDCNGDSTDFNTSVWFCCSDIGDTVRVVFRAYDCAANYNDCMVQVLVEDKLKPTCLPPPNITVDCAGFDPTLGGYGYAVAKDNCCMDTILASVNYNQFDSICNKGTILRTFRAYDCAGNSNQCFQRIFVEYREYYYLKMPDDKIVNVCDGTGNYGEPALHFEDCELIGLSYEDEVFTIVPEGCYRIDRHWRIINWCTYNPNGACIDIPNPDISQQRPFVLPGPIISPLGTLPPWSPTITYVNPTDPAPTNYSIFWSDNANCYTYKQMILVFDTKDPIIENCPSAPLTVCDLSTNNPALWNNHEWWDAGTESHDLCEGSSDLSITAYDACTHANVRFRYLLFLDLDNNGTMETVVNSNNPPPPGMIYYNNALNPNFSGGELRTFDSRPVPDNQKYVFSLHETITGNKKSAAIRWKTPQQLPNPGNPNGLPGVPPELPYGRHKIKWLVEDGCTNESFCEYSFDLRDCKPPTVVCLHGLSTNIEASGVKQLWASDFLQYTDDNCTPVPKIDIAIRKSVAGATGFPVDGNGDPVTGISFDCSEIGIQTVQLWGRDLAGNADFCETTVVVQDNLGVCGANATVSGVLLTEQQQGVEEVDVTLSGSSPLAPAFTYTQVSDNQGEYAFAAIPTPSEFTIIPFKDDNPTNGVTTYDLVEISKHILGIKPLDSPYKMIAADANRSGSITSSDLIDLRKLLLGINTGMQHNTSWRFIDKNYIFPNPLNPFQETFPETVSASTAQPGFLWSQFVAVKTGDVNGSAVPNALASADSRTDRTTADHIAYFKTDRAAGQLVREGEYLTLRIQSAQILESFQFTLQLHGLELTDFIPEENIRSEHVAYFPDVRALTVASEWSGSAAFTLKCKALKTGILQDMLSIENSITAALAYSGNSGSALLPALRFSEPEGIRLQEIQPNPLFDKTRVKFSLGSASEVNVVVCDSRGAPVWSTRKHFNAGANQLELDLHGTSATGLLFLTLETPFGSASGKMIREH